MRKIIITSLFTWLILPVSGQNTSMQTRRLKVFIDCNRGCDMNFIRTEINIVDFLLDRQAADVHVLITEQETGGGGTQFQFIFFGRAPGGKAMIRRIDMDVLSTATTMSRTPASYQHKLGLRVTHGGRFLEDQVKSEVRLPAGRRSSESLQLKRPILSFRHAPFLADPSQTIPPPTGHLVSIHGIQPQSRFLGDGPP